MDHLDLRALDEIAADATVSPIEVDVAGWWCKAAPDLPFRRCNVARPPLGAGRDPSAVRAALVEVRAWYAAHGRRLIVQVSSADPDAAALDAVLAAEGLALEAPVHLQVATLADLAAPAGPNSVDRPGGAPPIDHVAPGAAAISGKSVDRRVGAPAIDHVAADAPAIDRPGGAGVGVEVRAGVDEPWARAYGAIHGGGSTQEARTAAYGRMLAALGDRALAATVVDESGATIGLGFGVVDRGWLGIFGMGTAPGHRRRGIASSIVRALAVAAAEHGATRAYLQVETDNAPAIACYERLGFATSHGYHYRSDAPDPDQGC